MADILAHAHVNAGSLYYSFKTKRALLHAVLERDLASLDAIVITPVAERVSDPDADAETRALIAANFAAWTAVVEAWTRQARLRSAAHVDPALLARFVLSVMEGAVLQARMHRDIAYFDGSIRQLRQHFHTLTR